MIYDATHLAITYVTLLALVLTDDDDDAAVAFDFFLARFFSGDACIY